MTLLVRDEEDVIRQNIDYHLSQGVDYFIVTDNKSVDSTKEILLEYQQKGQLHYIFEPEDNYNQAKWVTRMARLAYTDFDADWVINNDADEFWLPNHGNLKTLFASIKPEYNIVSAQRHNFLPMPFLDGPFYSTMIFRKTESLNSLGTELLPKVAHRGHPNIKVVQGNHSVSGFEQGNTVADILEILHYPMRSYQQFLNKIVKGGAAYERNTELDKCVGGTWRRLYQDYCNTGSLQSFYQSSCFDRQSLADALNSNDMVEDQRLADYFKQRLIH